MIHLYGKPERDLDPYSPYGKHKSRLFIIHITKNRNTLQIFPDINISQNRKIKIGI